MKKYKVKITCPLFKKGDMFETDNVGLVWVTNLAFEPIFYPDVFEEIKEPLFVTDDGISIYDSDTEYWCVNIKTLSYHSCTFCNDDITMPGYVYLSTKEAAEKWIEENKPMFSKKQIRDAIDSVSLSEFSWDIKLIEILGL